MKCTKPIFVKVSLIGAILATTACAELGGQNANYFAPVVYEKNAGPESAEKGQTQAKTARLEASDDDRNTASSAAPASNAKAAPAASTPKPVQVASKPDPVKTTPDAFSGGAGGGSSGSSQLGGAVGGPKIGTSPSGSSNIASTATTVVKVAADAGKKAVSTVSNTANKAVNAVKNIKIKNPFK